MQFIPLIATLLALLSGPLIFNAARKRPQLSRWIDAFVLVCVTSLILVEVLPEAYGSGGWISLLFLGAGLLGPTLLEHGLTHARREAHFAALGLALFGLLLHSFGDGAALSPAGGQHLALAWAVAIHSLPVGLLVWWLMAPVFGARLPALTLAAMCGATLVGYTLGLELSQALDPRHLAWFQSLIAGSILHVVFGRPHSRA